MEAKVIIVSVVKSNKSSNNVFQVAISGQAKAEAFCKSAYKAMRFMFLLKKRTGLNISENCIAYLSNVIKQEQAAKAAALQQKVENLAESHSVDNVLAKAEEQKAEKPKRQRKSKKAAKTAAQ